MKKLFPKEVTTEIHEVAQVNEKQANEMMIQLESHIIPRLASQGYFYNKIKAFDKIKCFLRKFDI